MELDGLKIEILKFMKDRGDEVIDKEIFEWIRTKGLSESKEKISESLEELQDDTLIELISKGYDFKSYQIIKKGRSILKLN